MIERGSGRIIHISSVMGLIGEEFAPTALPRPALIGLTKVMALDLARHGIKVNCIAPGFIETETVQPIIDLMKSPRSPTPTPAPRPSVPARPATSATWRSSWPPTRAASSPAPPSPPTAASSPTDRPLQFIADVGPDHSNTVTTRATLAGTDLGRGLLIDPTFVLPYT